MRERAGNGILDVVNAVAICCFAFALVSFALVNRVEVTIEFECVASLLQSLVARVPPRTPKNWHLGLAVPVVVVASPLTIVSVVREAPLTPSSCWIEWLSCLLSSTNSTSLDDADGEGDEETVIGSTAELPLTRGLMSRMSCAQRMDPLRWRAPCASVDRDDDAQARLPSSATEGRLPFRASLVGT